jgi:hypothetical protein
MWLSRETILKVTPESSNLFLPKFSRHPRQNRFTVYVVAMNQTLLRWIPSICPNGFVPQRKGTHFSVAPQPVISLDARSSSSAEALLAQTQAPADRSGNAVDEAAKYWPLKSTHFRSGTIILSSLLSFIHHLRYFTQPLVLTVATGGVSLSSRLICLHPPLPYFITAFPFFTDTLISLFLHLHKPKHWLYFSSHLSSALFLCYLLKHRINVLAERDYPVQSLSVQLQNLPLLLYDYGGLHFTLHKARGYIWIYMHV